MISFGTLFFPYPHCTPEYYEVSTHVCYTSTMQNFKETEAFTNIKNKLLDYLSRQDYSEAKLLEKVLQLKKNYPSTQRYTHYTKKNVLIAIEHLKKYGIINEIRFLEAMLASGLRSEYGIRRITQRMYQRGYKKEHIALVLAKHKENENERDFSKIVRLAQQRKQTLLRKYPNEHPSQIKKRLIGYLAQKGFEYDEISSLLEQL